MLSPGYSTTGISIPRSIEELSAAWLEKVLQHAQQGVQVERLEIVKTIWGTSTKVLVEAEYASTGSPALPSQLCIKGEFDERLQATYDTIGVTPTEIEAMFYRDLAPKLGITIPNVWAAEWISGKGGILVLDNLADQGATFGVPSSTWAVQEVAGGLDSLAKLHGASWAGEYSNYKYIKVGSPPVRDIAQNVLFTSDNWQAVLNGPVAEFIPSNMRDEKRILEAYANIYSVNDKLACSLGHGDAHIGNTYIDGNGRLLFLDWASICLQPWAADVAYFMTSSLSILDRREHEVDLLKGYLDALCRYGGHAPSWEEAWTLYRQNQLHGIIWSSLPETMQPIDGIIAMTQRFVAAIEDHETLAALK